MSRTLQETLYTELWPDGVVFQCIFVKRDTSFGDKEPTPLRHFLLLIFFLFSHSFFFFFSAAPSAVQQLHIVQKVSATAFQNEKK